MSLYMDGSPHFTFTFEQSWSLTSWARIWLPGAFSSSKHVSLEGAETPFESSAWQREQGFFSIGQMLYATLTV